MTFTAATPARAREAAKASISASLRPSSAKGGPRDVVAITFKAAAQDQLFGGPIAGERFAIAVGRGEHHGLLRVEKRADGAFFATRLIAGSARLTIAAWDLLPDRSEPGQPCTIEGTDGNGVLIRLPAWAQRGVAQERVAAEFGLKPIPRRAAP